MIFQLDWSHSQELDLSVVRCDAYRGPMYDVDAQFLIARAIINERLAQVARQRLINQLRQPSVGTVRSGLARLISTLAERQAFTRRSRVPHPAC